MADKRQLRAGVPTVESASLQGRYVRLDPLLPEHLEALCHIGLDEELWRWMPVQVRTREHMSAFIEEALREQAQGKALPFATVDQASGQLIGSTRFGNIELNHRRAEIGLTSV